MECYFPVGEYYRQISQKKRTIKHDRKKPSEQRGRTLRTVSYTHLDVYKRQLLHRRPVPPAYIHFAKSLQLTDKAGAGQGNSRVAQKFRRILHPGSHGSRQACHGGLSKMCIRDSREPFGRLPAVRHQPVQPYPHQRGAHRRARKRCV